MKKIYLITLVLFYYVGAANAQGIFQLWGMTKDGGDDNTGMMFSTTSTCSDFQSRYTFNISNAGSTPQLTNLVEYNGKMYGMTQEGGINNSGIIFEWDPSTNTYTKKYAFRGIQDGSGPLGSLVLYNGKFYGMTESGGSQAQGAIFEWDPSTNIFTKKIDFIDNSSDGFNGYRPAGNLTMTNGKFYGMTAYGGTNDKGVIFEWDPATNAYAKKIDFTGTNGSRPFGNLTLKGTKFYGLTTLGGTNDKGVIFEWNPSSNAFTKKKEFNGTNGSNPYGNLVAKGSVFISVTQHGGTNDDGVIFEWDPSSNTLTKKYDFNDDDGYYPTGDLTLKDGKYYSTAFRGGVNDAGVIFEWDPALSQYTKMADLSTENGKYAQASLTLSNNKFYGLTSAGGNFGKGVIFEWDLSPNTYTKKIDFNDVSKGITPSGNLKYAAGKSYGITNAGGNNNEGVIFEWDASSNKYTKKFDFGTTAGSGPTGSLTSNEGKLYGMTKAGGDNDAGVIFEWDPSLNTYTKKIDLAFETGSSPQGSLILFGGKFYGLTSAGGSNGSGVIFEWDPATNIYTDKVDLSSSLGSKPYGDLAVYNGKLYGMTNKGGANNVGVIFEWDPSINTYVKKMDLSSANGKLPYGSLTLADGSFYGMTSSGGSNNKGVIFKWDPSANDYTKKMDFFNTDTYSPLGNLTMTGGKFYGMTRSGGDNDGGVVFEWDPFTNNYTKKKDLDAGSGGSLPGIITDISLAPAPVAKGTPGTCASFPSVTIDNSNNNIWVPIIDDNGNAVAEIKANGNNLGVVNVSMFINNGSVREDGTHRLYLDRNLTITPQFETLAAGTHVDIRLYIRNAEYLALKNAVNSNGDPSGINSINDIGIYKNSDACSSNVGFIASPVSSIAGTWESDYVFTSSITSFSSFYFANTAQAGPLPLTRIDFKGRLVNKDADITWETTDEYNTKSFDLERSTDGRNYKAIVNVAAKNHMGINQYSYLDNDIASLNAAVVYYRLKTKDIDGKFNYSGIVALSIKKAVIVLIYPNPVADKANITISIDKPETVQLRIIDNTGRLIKQQQLNLSANSTSLSVDVSELPKATYYLELKGATVNEHKQLLKQ